MGSGFSESKPAAIPDPKLETSFGSGEEQVESSQSKCEAALFDLQMDFADYMFRELHGVRVNGGFSTRTPTLFESAALGRVYEIAQQVAGIRAEFVGQEEQGGVDIDAVKQMFPFELQESFERFAMEYVNTKGQAGRLISEYPADESYSQIVGHLPRLSIDQQPYLNAVEWNLSNNPPEDAVDLHFSLMPVDFPWRSYDEAQRIAGLFEPNASLYGQQFYLLTSRSPDARIHERTHLVDRLTTYAHGQNISGEIEDLKPEDFKHILLLQWGEFLKLEFSATIRTGFVMQEEVVDLWRFLARSDTPGGYNYPAYLKNDSLKLFREYFPEYPLDKFDSVYETASEIYYSELPDIIKEFSNLFSWGVWYWDRSTEISKSRVWTQVVLAPDSEEQLPYLGLLDIYPLVQWPGLIERLKYFAYLPYEITDSYGPGAEVIRRELASLGKGGYNLDEDDNRNPALNKAVEEVVEGVSRTQHLRNTGLQKTRIGQALSVIDVVNRVANKMRATGN